MSEERKVIELDDYQQLAARTDNMDLGRPLWLANGAMGLAGEAGEVVEIIKKHLTHGHDVDRDKLKKELGDVIWYAAKIARAFEIKMSEVATANIEKLAARYPDGFSNALSQNRKPGDE